LVANTYAEGDGVLVKSSHNVDGQVYTGWNYVAE